MVKRRKMLVGLGALAAGGITATGTGAFTSVEANRGLDIHTPYDSDALLALAPEDNSPNGEYVEAGQDSMSIDFGGDGTITDADGYGLNDDAVTEVRDMFKITNQGTQTVVVSIDGLPDGVTLVHGDSDSWEDPVLEPGDTLNDVGMIFDTSNLGQFHQDIQITAEAVGNAE